jgi:hypothetical protein
MNIKFTIDSCRNEELFNLKGTLSVPLRPAVVEYLRSRDFPWELLGKPLAEFVSARIAEVEPTKRLQGNISPMAFLENKDSIVIEEGAVVEAGAYISGPTFIESGATVRHGAYIRGQAYICQGAVVGHASEVKGALLLNGAKAAHFAYVGDSILGQEANLGAGTKCANLRLDHREVKVVVGGTSIPSGLKKFGAIFGHAAQSGCNAVTNPGTILAPSALVLPNTTATGFVGGRPGIKLRTQ